MRSVPAGSFARLSEAAALWRAFLRCRRGKRGRAAMARFDLDADQHVLAVHRALANGSWRPGPHHVRIVCDPKRRLVAAAPIADRVVHQALLGELAPHYQRRFIDQHFACSEGRGPHRAALLFLRLSRAHRFRLSLDVRRYFPSINLEILRGLWFRPLGDPRTRGLIDQLLESGAAVYRHPLAVEALGLDREPLPPGAGLPIGSYFSHFSGALYLDGLDHFVKRELKIAGYLRYMDDFTLFGDDRAALETARARIVEWLARERHLELGRKRWEVFDTRQSAEFVGFRVSRAGLRPGRKMRRRMRMRLDEAAAKGPAALERALVAYRGLLTFG